VTEQKLHVWRIANDYVHDMCAGLFPGAVAATWIVKGAMDAAEQGGGAAVRAASGGVWFVLVGALSLLALTGTLRLRYWRLNVREGFIPTKARMAAIKHFAFVATQLLAAWALAVL